MNVHPIFDEIDNRAPNVANLCEKYYNQQEAQLKDAVVENFIV